MLSKKLLALAFASASLLAISPAGAAVIFTDNFNSYSQAIPWNGGGNWTVAPGGSVDLVQSGNFSIDCMGGTGGCVDMVGTAPGGETNGEIMNSAAFSLLGGQVYNFSFAYSGNQRGDVPSAFNASIVQQIGPGYGPPGPPLPVFSSGLLNSESGWLSYSASFTPLTSGQYAINFDQPAGPGNQGNIIDDVLVTGPVPEPATWAMMLVGFGAVGYSLRRRRGTQRMPQMV